MDATSPPQYIPADRTAELSAYILGCNEWLVAPENVNAPQWLRNMMIATREWVEDVREIAG